MSRALRLAIPAIVLAATAWLACQWLHPSPQVTRSNLVTLPESTQGFTSVDGPVALSFPADFGPHPDHQTEWWYYTGNLETTDGRHFGYQLTIFRRAILPPDQVPPRTSRWATDQIYMAHFALTDVSAGKFRSFERLERGAAGLAGAQGGEQYRVWLENWSVAASGPDEYHLHAEQNGLVIDLDLTDAKGPILQGDRGYSQKAPDPGNASHYYSQTHLVSRGQVTSNGQTYSVNGLSWMDHEWSSSALSQGQVGWNWFDFQLSDGSDLMVYAIRRSDGSIDAFSSGIWVAPDGKTRLLKRDDFIIQTLSTWKSSYSGSAYPSRWRVQVSALNLDLEVIPYLADQEHHLSVVYWEGAVYFSGTQEGKSVSGSGYVEQTGYAGSLAGRF